MAQHADEDVLLALLNTTPVMDGVQVDELADRVVAKRWLTTHGGSGSDRELESVLVARNALQSVVREQTPRRGLAALLHGVRLVPDIGPDGLTWALDSTTVDALLPARMVLAWGELERTRPGRLRACANSECRLFLLDRSNGNRAQWCSMAICGNRMKARRHYDRSRQAEA